MIKESSITKPLVSVLMTAFNREKYIGQAIESVMNSTYQNWELIVVDDCSKDSTLEIARKYEQEDGRIKVYENEKNLGDYPNRNRAASYARGKYLKYVDADDMIYRHGLEIIVDNMEQYPEAGWGIMTQKGIPSQPYPFLVKKKDIYRLHYINKTPLLNRAPLSVVIEKSVFEKEGGFNNIRHSGDADFWHRLGLKHDMVLMQDGIVWWRGHPDQEHKKRTYKLDVFLKSVKMVENYLEQNQISFTKSEKRKLENNLKKARILYMLRLVKSGRTGLILRHYFTNN